MRILIVEDEFFIAQSIVIAVKSYNYTPLEPVDTYDKAIYAIEHQAPDLCIFDIELSGSKTGLDLAKTVKEKHPHLPYIILTGKTSKKTIHLAKYVNPASILIKPFHSEGLFASIELAFHNHNSKDTSTPSLQNTTHQDFLFIKQKDGLIKIKHQDIIYIKSDGVYMDVKTTDNKIFTDRSSIDNYLNKLDDRFIRIHRSFIINLDYLEKIVESTHVSIQGEFIPIGRKFKQFLFTKLDIN